MAIIAKGVKASKPEKTTKNFEEKISKKILNLLGRPRDMKRINAINVFGTRYRVNVWCDTALGCVITHSYFVVVDEDGKILSTNPGIEKNEN